MIATQIPPSGNFIIPLKTFTRTKNGESAIASQSNQILVNKTTTNATKGRTSKAEKQTFTKVITNFCHNHLPST